MQSEIIQNIIEFFENCDEVIAVYLFGSYSKGKERKGSDVDLAVLLKHSVVSYENEFKRKYTVGLGSLLRRDFHIVTMNKAGEQLMAQIFKHGKCILNHQPRLLSRFKMSTYSRIAEFNYHRDRMKLGFLHRVMGETS